MLSRDPGGPGRWRAGRRRKGVHTPLGAVGIGDDDAAWRQLLGPGRRERVVILLDQPFLTRRTQVPAAAAANLEQLLGYEMDRLTPFAANEVLVSHRVVSRDTAAGTLLVDLAIAPRLWIADLLDRLRDLAIQPDALEAPADGFAEPDQGARLIALGDADPVRRARARLFWRCGMGLAGALAIALALTPVVRQSLALADAEERIDALKPRLAQVDALRRRIAAGSAGAGQIAAARQRAANVLLTLGELTDLLPDDTYLTSISLRHDRLTIEGHSNGANKLIGSMASEPRLKNPAFSAPLTRAENGKDVFTIQAGLGAGG